MEIASVLRVLQLLSFVWGGPHQKPMYSGEPKDFRFRTYWAQQNFL